MCATVANMWGGWGLGWGWNHGSYNNHHYNLYNHHLPSLSHNNCLEDMDNNYDDLDGALEVGDCGADFSFGF